jgi:hypothetical protein
MADQTSTTGTSVTTTAGDAGQQTQTGATGGVTDTSTQSQGNQGTATTTTTTGTSTDNSATQDAQVTAALKLLEERGLLGKDLLTKKQFDGHMGAARKQWEKESADAAAAAAAEAERVAREKQGQFEPLYKSEQEKTKQLEADNQTLRTEIEGWRSRENKRIDEAVKGLPAVIKEFDPGPDNFQQRVEWYDKVQKHSSELQGKVVPGTGFSPSPTGSQNNDKEARVAQTSLYRTF